MILIIFLRVSQTLVIDVVFTIFIFVYHLYYLLNVFPLGLPPGL